MQKAIQKNDSVNNLTHLTPVLGTVMAEGSNLSLSQVFDDNKGNEGKQISQILEDVSAQLNNTPTETQEEDQSSLELIENHLTMNYDFRYNIVSGRLEYKGKEETIYEQLNDYKLNSIIRKLGKKHLKVSSQSLRTTILSDFTPSFNPFSNYFNSLTAWDGRTDYIQQLVETVKTTNDEIWHKWFRKWIVAAYACAVHDNIINHAAIVFVGKQGTGKTTWMHRLVPASLKNYYFSGIPNLKNKDAKIRLAECFLINLDELDSLGKASTERLKEIITAFEVRERRPYAQFDDTMPRRASFMGSVNNKQFLNDTTGNRRFLCFEVNEINYLHQVNIDNVYAQAKALFESGFQYHFDTAETEAISEHNEQFQMVSYVEELILKYFETVDPETATPTHTLSSTDIAGYLAQKSSIAITDSNIQKIGRVMRKHDFKKIKVKSQYVYALKEKGKRNILRA